MTDTTETVGGAEPLRVVAAEDNLLVREGLTTMLARRSDVSLGCVCESVTELVDAIDRHRPHVVLTDIRMPPDYDREGIDVARRLRVTHPTVGVVVISAHLDPEYASLLFEDGTGRRGYIVKDRLDDAGRLVRGLRTVAGGGSFVDDDVLLVLARRRSRPADSPLARLTDRERDVLTELATGRNNAAIADALCVSRHAVEKHCNSIFAKLGLSEEADLNRRVAAVLMLVSDRPVAA